VGNCGFRSSEINAIARRTARHSFFRRHYCTRRSTSRPVVVWCSSLFCLAINNLAGGIGAARRNPIAKARRTPAQSDASGPSVGEPQASIFSGDAKCFGFLALPEFISLSAKYVQPRPHKVEFAPDSALKGTGFPNHQSRERRPVSLWFRLFFAPTSPWLTRHGPCQKTWSCPRYRWFESTFLQQSVTCELDFGRDALCTASSPPSMPSGE